MNKKIFIACDTNNISKVKKIIKLTQTKKLKIGYKFGLEFLNTKYGRAYVSKKKKKIIFGINILSWNIKFYKQPWVVSFLNQLLVDTTVR